ncbi:hypothetical protein [Natronosalvus rutilus]|uniref:C2H2-type domain-containing protein n=1 Tax=Natronosalvus rutilus TaxID=2953753 RepID=A0A9E7NEJ1_9EURY|nr:hypothetical protein [Natronosalvus rutilus]UTF55881.1 hypothetical protein NGM29_20610 [Natronosalvus rutilus]
MTPRSFVCPSPDCSHSTGGAAELAEHVNTEHSGEFRRKDWPATEAGRASLARDRVEDKE